jgi:gentisate 1,2-dioxygenase
VIAGRVFEWEDKDTFVVPSWSGTSTRRMRNRCCSRTTDSAALRPLGLYREELLEENGGRQKVEGAFEPLPVAARAGA